MFFDIEIETMKQDDMKKLQLIRLQNMIDYCIERVPFYKKKLNSVGIFQGSQITSLKDIDNIPFTTKQEIMENYPDGLLAVPKSEIVRIHASSGTTNKPVIGYYTKKDMELWRKLAARVLVLNGLTKEDIIQISVGYGLFTGAFGFHGGAEEIGSTIVPASTGNTQKQIIMLKDIGVTAFMATPSYATYISDIINNSDISLDDLKLKKVLLGAERCTKSMRRTIEKNLGVVTADNYGLTEFFGPGVSGECEFQEGLHISEDAFYPEIINPETGQVLKDGEQGELVFTSLCKEGMPLLRYRTRDITILNHEKCKCGRTSVRMNAPFARSDDMFVFKGVNVFPTQIEYIIDGIDGLSPFYKIRLERKNYKDTATIFIELSKKKEFYSDDELKGIVELIKYKLSMVVIVKMNIELVEPETLERFTGKSKRVEDLRYVSETL